MSDESTESRIRPQPKLPVEAEFARYLVWILAVHFALCCGVFGLTYPVQPDSSMWLFVPVCRGGVGAGFLLIVFQLVFFEVALPVRILVAAVLGFVTAGMIWLGSVFAFCQPDYYRVADSAPIMPLMFLAAATPFAWAKFFLGWQIERVNTQRETERVRMSISGILIATTLFAASVSLIMSVDENLLSDAILFSLIELTIVWSFVIPLGRRLLNSSRYQLETLTVEVFAVLVLSGLLVADLNLRPGSNGHTPGIEIGTALASFFFFLSFYFFLIRKSGWRLTVRNHVKT